MAKPIPIPGAIPIDGAITSVISIGTEEVRRIIQGRKRTRVKSLEEKRKLMKTEVTPNNAEFTRDEQGLNIYIVDLDSKDDEGNSTFEQIQLQTVPKVLRYDPEATYNAIKPMARNNPFYHYTGGEDTLEFELDWYSDKGVGIRGLDEQRIEPLKKAKWLEAKSRNNGLDEPPHRVKLLWGGEDDGEGFYFPAMFNDAIFIVHHAPYDMGLFHKGKGLRPTQIKQMVTLKRVTETNRTLNEILRLSS